MGITLHRDTVVVTLDTTTTMVMDMGITNTRTMVDREETRVGLLRDLPRT
jgi:hypothetical protein